MKEYIRTSVIIIVLALVLFVASYVMLILAGIDPFIALVWNVLSSLGIGLDIIPDAVLSQGYVLWASVLDAFVFALLTVALATLFFNFIRRINLSRRLVMTKVRRIRQHVIVVPYNSFAHNINKDLKAAGQKTVIITDSEIDAHRLYREGELVVVADPKTVEAFTISGIGNAKYVIACSDDDVLNAMITIAAKSANARARIVSRVANFDNIAKLGAAGAYRMMLPEVTAGTEIGEEIIKKVMTQ